MNQDYQELIRQMLDEAGLINKELTFGCLCKDPAGQVFSLVDDSREKLFDVCYQSFGIAGVSKDVDIEILGHPWDLREVMAWFQKKYPEYASEVLYYDGKHNLFECLEMYIDLSKPLSQQDLKPLYELMLSLKK